MLLTVFLPRFVLLFVVGNGVISLTAESVASGFSFYMYHSFMCSPLTLQNFSRSNKHDAPLTLRNFSQSNKHDTPPHSWVLTGVQLVLHAT